MTEHIDADALISELIRTFDKNHEECCSRYYARCSCGFDYNSAVVAGQSAEALAAAAERDAKLVEALRESMLNLESVEELTSHARRRIESHLAALAPHE